MIAAALARWTEILAFATFVVAAVGVAGLWFTGKLASAAQRTAEIDARALANSVRPLVLPVPPDQFGELEGLDYALLGQDVEDAVAGNAIDVRAVSDDTWLVSVPVRNAGNGPAVISVPDPSIRLRSTEATSLGQATGRVLPVGERTRLQFSFTAPPQDFRIEPGRLEAFYVQVAYTDADGGQLRRTEIAIDNRRGRFEAVGFAFYNGADGDLIVASGKGWDVGTRQREWW